MTSSASLKEPVKDCHKTVAPIATPAITTIRRAIARMVFLEGISNPLELEFWLTEAEALGLAETRTAFISLFFGDSSGSVFYSFMEQFPKPIGELA